MWYIDFVPGSHGHFLEFVCNKFLAGCVTAADPFNLLGSSHLTDSDYQQHKVFHAAHWSQTQTQLPGSIIHITFDAKDLLLLSSICFWRAGDVGIDNNLLHEHTYHKLHNRYYQHMIAELNAHFPQIELSSQNPHCARHVLREYFKLGFRDPNQHGLMRAQNLMSQYQCQHKFEFERFYHEPAFLQGMQDLADLAHMPIQDPDGLTQLHKKFLQRQPYRYHAQMCDDVLMAVAQGLDQPIPDLTLLQEAWIDAALECRYHREMPAEKTTYWRNTQQILDYVRH